MLRIFLIFIIANIRGIHKKSIFYFIKIPKFFRLLSQQFKDIFKNSERFTGSVYESHIYWSRWILTSYLYKQKIDLFLRSILTIDEKRVLYNNKCTNQWLPRNQLAVPTSKPSLSLKKVLLWVWWDFSGIFIVTVEFYCHKLDWLQNQL